jgi:hypothetical protein
VYTKTGLSGLEETMVISLTCITFTDSQWENDKWPIFAHAGYFHGVASIYRRLVFVKNTIGGKPAEDVQ